MTHSVASLSASPNSLAAFYRDFRVDERLLFTGHSHQAWPDCAKDALLACHRDAAELVDDKWGPAFEQAERVREGYRRLLGDPRAELVLGQNTHELVVRFLSALPLKQRPRLVTSDAEFHSLRRQLSRLAEEGIEVVRVPASPVETLSERLSTALRQDCERTAAVLVSSVLFTTSEVVPHLASLAEACDRAGAELLLDAYHQLNVVPCSLAGLERAFVVGGGYKYCQLGEGNCFLRVPEHCALRPVVTGWFAEFGLLDHGHDPANVAYPPGAERFAGSTYDPVSHYRAAAVFDFFAAQGLTPCLLQQVSQHQIGLLAREIERLDLPPARLTRATRTPLAELGGFLALRSSRASDLVAKLEGRGVKADSRGDIVRLGPAPYLSDRQIGDAAAALGEAVRALG